MSLNSRKASRAFVDKNSRAQSNALLFGRDLAFCDRSQLMSPKIRLQNMKVFDRVKVKRPVLRSSTPQAACAPDFGLQTLAMRLETRMSQFACATSAIMHPRCVHARLDRAARPANYRESRATRRSWLSFETRASGEETVLASASSNDVDEEQKSRQTSYICCRRLAARCLRTCSGLLSRRQDGDGAK